MLGLISASASLPAVADVWRELDEAVRGGPVSPIGFDEAVSFRDAESPSA
ncbi:MAG: hypothetical protein RIB67_00835 [Miltoncostaeaceae bacterium]